MKMRQRLSGLVFLALVSAAVLAATSPSHAADLPSPKRVAQIVPMLPPEPIGVGRPISDRAAWKAVAAAPGFSDVIARAEKLAGQPIPDYTDDDYLDFSRTGNRTRGQLAMSARSSRINTLVLAECLENRGRFLPAIEATIFALREEKSWVLPAHDRSLRTFKGGVRDIDLASSARSWTLATADYWLGDKLSPEVRKVIRSELERRTFAPYESRLKTGEPSMFWITTTNNWNAVCLAGVTGAALAVIDSPERRAFYVAAAEKLIQNFLDGFTSDGYCSEGLGYWNYGFGHFVLLAETVRQATGGRMDWMEIPKIRAVSQFCRRLEILPGVYPAFADCHLRSKSDTRITAFVSRRLGLGWLEEERRGLALAAGPEGSLFALGMYDFPNAASQRSAAEAASAPGLRDWFADAGILICRPASGGRGLGAALKGGHNAEHHNHNDVGSYVVALGKSTPLLDPGSEVYTARTFSKDRYASQVLNSFGHAVPRVAGKLQREGRAAAARVVKTEFTDPADTMVLDLRSPYDVKELQKLERTFVFSRQWTGSLTVTDEVEFTSPQSFGTALVTLSKWRSLGDGQLLIGEGADAVQVRITVDGAKYRIDPTEIRETLPGSQIPTRLGIELTEPVQKAKIEVAISPAAKP